MSLRTIAHRRGRSHGVSQLIAGVVLSTIAVQNPEVVEQLFGKFISMGPRGWFALNLLMGVLAVWSAVSGLLLILGKEPAVALTGRTLLLGWFRRVALRDIRAVNVVAKSSPLLSGGLGVVLMDGRVELISAEGWVEPMTLVQDAILSATRRGTGAVVN